MIYFSDNCDTSLKGHFPTSFTDKKPHQCSPHKNLKSILCYVFIQNHHRIRIPTDAMRRPDLLCATTCVRNNDPFSTVEYLFNQRCLVQ